MVLSHSPRELLLMSSTKLLAHTQMRLPVRSLTVLATIHLLLAFRAFEGRTIDATAPTLIGPKSWLQISFVHRRNAGQARLHASEETEWSDCVQADESGSVWLAIAASGGSVRRVE